MKLSCSIVALVTPMQEDGSIDFEALSALLEWHVASRTTGIVVAGSTGESVSLTTDERYQLVAETAKKINKRLPVIAGTGASSTETTIELTRAAEKAGADAALIVTPYYNKPTQLGLYQHYKTIANACSLPIILYNVPSRTGVDLLPETIASLREIKHIIGIKEATSSLERAEAIRKLCGPDFLILSGDDQTALEFMLHRVANGVISVTANVSPTPMQSMCEAAMSGNKDEAHQLNKTLALLHQNLFLESNPIPTKWALQMMGKIKGGIRLPLTSLDKQYHQDVKKAMQEAGIFEEVNSSCN